MDNSRVTNEEILRFDPMVHKIIKQEILQYWASGVAVYSKKNEATIGRLGMSFDDLMQFGRLLVFKQIKWFNEYGLNPKTGLPYNAKLSTLMHQYLRNKFMSLSKSFASKKSGGQVVNVEENRRSIQKFIDDFSYRKKVQTNQKLLTDAIKCPKEVIKLIERQESNDKLFQLSRKILIEMESISHVSYEDICTFAAASNTLSPEGHLLVKEEVEDRIADYCEKKNMDVLSLNDYLKRGKSTKPVFLPKGQTTRLMKLANERGINSQRQLAQELGIGMTTLSNIIRGRSRGTSNFRNNLEEMFNRSFDDLMQVINDKESI